MRVLTRRQMLAGLGAGLGLAPFVPALELMAEQSGVPKRLLVFYQAHASILHHWRPEGSETDFALSNILAPLTPFRDRLIVLDGLVAGATGGADAHAHVRGGYGLTTGRSAIAGGSKGHPAGLSFDQLIANAVGDATAFKSLQFGVGSSPHYSAAVAGPSAPIPPEIDPAVMFQRLFEDFDPSDEGAAARRLAKRRSVLDAVDQNLGLVREGVGVADRHRLDAHLDSVREIEKTLEQLQNAGGCAPPDLPAGLEPSDPEAFATIGPVQRQLITAALACDLTRVITFQWGNQSGGNTFSWLGAEDDYHHTAHRAGAGSINNAETYLPAAVWFAEQFRDLLAQLEAVDVGDGTLLDHTLVAWMGTVGHGISTVPIVLAGGERLGLRTGRYLQLDGETNDLMVRIAQLMGLPEVDTFGDPAHCTGPLPNLT
jgi:hypothetical protein